MKSSSGVKMARMLAMAAAAAAASASALVAHAAPLAMAPKRGNPVTVDLHVMSICPDGVYCKGAFQDVLAEVGSIVHFTNQYIAQVEGDGFVCKHGEPECEGNILQLCTRYLYPEVDDWYAFVLCQDETYQSIPDNAELCAQRAGLDLAPVYECMATWGQELHRDSIALTNARGITKSCTVAIDGVPVCIRDGGEWYNCTIGYDTEDFVRAICDAYTGSDTPAACL